MKRDLLPNRPLRVKGRSRVMTIVGLVMLVGMAFGTGSCTVWFGSTGATILRDKSVWSSGLPADGGTIDFKRTSKIAPWLMADYEGTVRYSDAEGATYEGKVSYWTMFGGPDTSNVALRYDPQHHDRFALSWGVEASGARWRATIVFTLILAFLTLAALVGVWAVIMSLRAESRVAAEGDEVELRVISSSPVFAEGKPTGEQCYVLEVSELDPPKQITRNMKSLFFTTADQSRVLGLWKPGSTEDLVVLASDLTPLDLPDRERVEIMTRAQQR